MLPPK